MYRNKVFFALSAVFLFIFPTITISFCGFYVSKADTSIYNQTSKVVIARKDDKTVITMASDFSGDVNEFAVVIPVPTVIEKEQVHVTENAIIEHLDAYTTPRLVEYFDPNPCIVNRALLMAEAPAKSAAPGGKVELAQAVKIEAKYTVDEYDIVLLSSGDSGALSEWLNANGYKIPKGAEEVLSSYIKQGVYFFLAKVNLDEFNKRGEQTYLRPLQVAFESKKFMLPVRLGTVNAKGDQELFIFTITNRGRVEPTNYRLIKMPTDAELPLMVRKNFADVYKDIFNIQVNRENKAIFLEYAWDMSWCDPCAADPLSAYELRQLGAFWVPNSRPDNPLTKMAVMPNPVQGVFVTRMHTRYNSKTFPDDISFQETSDTRNFQARYILRNPWDGVEECEAASDYKRSLGARYEEEAKTLANLAGYDINKIRNDIKQYNNTSKKEKLKWYQEIWHNEKNIN